MQKVRVYPVFSINTAVSCEGLFGMWAVVNKANGFWTKPAFWRLGMLADVGLRTSCQQFFLENLSGKASENEALTRGNILRVDNSLKQNIYPKITNQKTDCEELRKLSKNY